MILKQIEIIIRVHKNWLNCDGNCLIDNDGDGICDDEIEGCGDQIDENLDSSLKIQMEFVIIWVKNDSLYIEFNPE